jgi:DNA-binding NarL/FixJ family response regulator
MCCLRQCPTDEVRVVVVDNRPVVRAGLITVLSDDERLRVVGEAEDAADALCCIEETKPAIVITSTVLPDVEGIELCRHLVSRHPEVPVILLSPRFDELSVSSALALGAAGFLVTTSDPITIRQATRVVAAGGVFLDPTVVARRQTIAQGPFGLTPGELKVLEQLPRGLTNKSIGVALSIAEDTVKTHMRRILFKLEARDRAQAVAIALREGVL